MVMLLDQVGISGVTETDQSVFLQHALHTLQQF